jgi:hypothetical protein
VDGQKCLAWIASSTRFPCHATYALVLRRVLHTAHYVARSKSTIEATSYYVRTTGTGMHVNTYYVLIPSTWSVVTEYSVGIDRWLPIIITRTSSYGALSRLHRAECEGLC